MQDSNREKRRLLGFIASRGGRITSGRNDSLLRWVFEIFAREDYTHERIGEVEDLLVSLEADGDVVLERDERGKLFAAALADRVNFDHADISQELFESNGEWWNLITAVMAQNSRLQGERSESGVEAAFELALSVEHAHSVALTSLAVAEARIAELSSQQQLEVDFAALEAERNQLRNLLNTAQSRISTLEGVLRDERADRAEEKRKLRNRLSDDGNRIAELERELRSMRRLLQERGWQYVSMEIGGAQTA